MVHQINPKNADLACDKCDCGLFTIHADGTGECNMCGEPFRIGVLTIEQAGLLSQLMRGVEQGAKLRFWPFGADEKVDSPRHTSYVMRAFTYENGNLYPHDADIREAFVWCSGTFEHWFQVSDLLRAIDNAVTGKHGMASPMAAIDFDK